MKDKKLTTVKNSLLGDDNSKPSHGNVDDYISYIHVFFGAADTIGSCRSLVRWQK